MLLPAQVLSIQVTACVEQMEPLFLPPSGGGE